MAVKAPPPPPKAAVATWTGYYAGVNIGYGIGDDPTTVSTVSGAAFPGLTPGTPIYGAPRSFSIDPKGVIGGGQVGYNLQFAPSWVAGFEADIQGSGMRNQQNCIIPCGAPISTVPTGFLTFFPVTFSTLSEEHKIDWFGTVRGRFGYAAGPVLVYATGGLAYGEVNRNGNVVGQTNFILGGTVNSFAGSYSASSTKAGWTLGGGVEGQLTTNWSVKAEYLYIDLGTTTDSFSTFYTSGFPATGQAGLRTVTSSFRENIFRAGLNYKWGG
ncbi:outer membrane immunogenic protein [Rhodoplanes sp. JGI PP 4-B12]|uniref:outer membrane protein n=1 Tax=Rhodoplanes sp. JGI PP 4-B12 TaxID=1873883 RepID=UPI000B736C4A|nr:outer membrane beta-barrel protein [Rhodoplanes sp. JGI PP 4-B12]SNB58527.1 outer membrane immunogenic protein [Rhodoplanes sp. JGI PP 4-B12]